MKTTNNNNRQVNKLKVFPKKMSDNKEREREREREERDNERQREKEKKSSPTHECENKSLRFLKKKYFPNQEMTNCTRRCPNFD